MMIVARSAISLRTMSLLEQPCCNMTSTLRSDQIHLPTTLAGANNQKIEQPVRVGQGRLDKTIDPKKNKFIFNLYEVLQYRDLQSMGPILGV